MVESKKKSQPPQGAAGRGSFPQGEDKLASKRNKLRYYEAKRSVLNGEKKNYEYLCFLQSSENWLKAFNHSAVIFAEKVAKEIGSKATLQPDRDHEVQAEVVTSISNIESFLEKMKAHDYKLVKHEGKKYVFLLKEPVTVDEYNLMRVENKTMVERTGKIVVPNASMPHLAADLRELYHTIFFEVKNQHPTAREMIGLELAKIPAQMLAKYAKVARKKKADVKEFLIGLLDDVEELNGLQYALDALRITDDKKMFRIAEQNEKVRIQILYEMKVIGIKDVDEKYGRTMK